MMKVLNLYAGLGGNRNLWPADIEVAAVELMPDIADFYKSQYPHDTVIIGDAHDFLLKNYAAYDFIWSSPPCPSHSRLNKIQVSSRQIKPRYPDLSLYQEILFLRHFFSGKWVVENVIPYYTPLIRANSVARHLFWADCYIPDINIRFPVEMGKITNNELMEWLDINIEGSRIKSSHKAQVLCNCVHPVLGLHVFNAVIKGLQLELFVKEKEGAVRNF